MNKLQFTGAALAVGAAALFSVAPAFADDAAVAAPMVHCMGVNSCKGTSACSTAENKCKGLNSCKGKGWMELSKAECEKEHGTVMDSDMKSDM
jgi:uncharacterized membrane protein